MSHSTSNKHKSKFSLKRFIIEFNNRMTFTNILKLASALLLSVLALTVMMVFGSGTGFLVAAALLYDVLMFISVFFTKRK